MNIDSIETHVEIASTLLKALSNESRLLIVCALYKRERSVGELEEIVNISQSALSQHLARLRKNGLVRTRREAQTIFYSMSDGATASVLHCLHGIYCSDGE